MKKQKESTKTKGKGTAKVSETSLGNSLKKSNAPNDEPVHIPLSFEDAIKLAASTTIKKKEG